MIGEAAFEGLTNVRSVRPNEGLETLGRHSLVETQIASFAAPTTLKEVGELAFHNCTNLKRVALGGVREIGPLCLLNTAVEDVEPSEFENANHEYLGIGYNYECAQVIPNGVQDVWEERVDQSAQLVFVPASVTELGHDAFRGCEQLKRVVFQEGSRLERVGDRCFESSGLEEIALPVVLREVGHGAFDFCPYLRTVYVWEGCPDV